MPNTLHVCDALELAKQMHISYIIWPTQTHTTTEARIHPDFHVTTPFSSVQFSCSVVSDSLQPHESQHARPPCPSPTPGVNSDSRPSSQWCHPAISSSVVPFSYLQSLPASESFPVSQLFSWGGQSTGVSASASFLPKNTQDWSSFRMDWLDLLAVQRTLKSPLQHHSSKASILRRSAFFTVLTLTSIHDHWKNHSLD